MSIITLVARTLSPTQLFIAIAVVGAISAASFGAGMIVEARWSQQLILTHAEQEKDKAIASLKEKVAEMNEAARQEAQARADRETEETTQVQPIIEEAVRHATDQEALPADLTRALDRAGGVRDDAKR